MKSISFSLYICVAAILLSMAVPKRAGGQSRFKNNAINGAMSGNTGMVKNMDKKAAPMSRIKDAHSLSMPNHVGVTHADMDLYIDFNKKTISGSVTWKLRHMLDMDNKVIFDTRDLDIARVTLDDGTDAHFTMGTTDSILGTPLVVDITHQTKSVTIYYKTAPNATALQWLNPSQTFGKQFPFLYTQSESIHARSWIPCQDGPGIRFTYNATVHVPKGLMALMSAHNPQSKNEDGVYRFDMEIPIPAYLMALAVGDISFKSIDNRTGVYAETVLLPKAAAELTDLGRMVDTAEALYGPYRWGRYDVLVLPSGFPIGGMENPRLTFATPTILAGDKSLVNLISHELAHNWSGNLVTNATWNDFWLNEGFTMYFERRITEKLHDKSYVDMLWELGYQDLTATVDELGRDNPDTRLKLNLDGRDPELGLTDIAYEKGCHFLWLIEKTVGRERFDRFLREYFDSHAFQSETTEGFIVYLKENLLKGHEDWAKAINVDAWVYGTGIPADCPRADHQRFDMVEKEIAAFEKGTPASQLHTAGWSTYEWMHFLRHLPQPVSNEQMNALDSTFHFTNTGNSEIADLWFLQAIRSNYSTAFPAMEAFLTVTGRQKFLEPLYKEMMKTDSGKQMAWDIYGKARPNYHPLAQHTVDAITGYNQ